MNSNIKQHRLLCPSFMSTFTCVCSEEYLAVPLTERGNIAVWKTENPSEEPVTLIGHYKTVKALCLSHAPTSYYLCSCSSDSIIIWNLTDNNGKPTKGKLLHSNMDQPLFSQFSVDNSKIAFSFRSGIWIFDLKVNQWIVSTEKTHLSPFLFKKHEILGVEENSLKVWNLQSNEITQKVSIALGFPSAICIHEQSEVLIIGSTCGQVLVYGENYRLMKAIQVWKLLMQYKQNNQSEESSLTESDSFPIYSLEVFNLNEWNNQKELLQNPIYLLLVTSTCFLLINICNEEVIIHKSFNDDFGDKYDKEENIGLVRSASTSLNWDKSIAYLCLIPVIGESLAFYNFSIKEVIKSKEIMEKWMTKDSLNLDLNETYFTFLNRDTSDGSLLIPKSQAISKTKTDSKKDLPVTFHSKVKSSGYGKKCKSMTMFQPQINKVEKSKSLNSLFAKDSRVTPATSKSFTFDFDEKTTDYKKLKLQCQIESFEVPTVSSLHVTANGQYASCTSSTGLIDVLKIGNKNIKIAYTLNAHEGEVKSARWSHTSKLLITAGGDKTTKIWNSGKLQPLLTIGRITEDPSSDQKNKFIFEDTIEQAQFYYLDRFILIASGNGVYLFDYSINIEKTGIKNFINKSRIKLIKKIPMDMKRVTTIAAMNQFFSNLAISTGSSKSLNIIDMAVGKVQCCIDDPSTRLAHLISLNEGSPFTSQVPSMYDIFLSAYQFDGIKVWDIRTKECVLNYKEHKCRTVNCGAVFSHCGKYIATGSEDKSVYIYDLRQLPAMCKLTDPHVDAFTSVSFLPKTQLLASSLNGLISFYGDIGQS